MLLILAFTKEKYYFFSSLLLNDLDTRNNLRDSHSENFFTVELRLSAKRLFDVSLPLYQTTLIEKHSVKCSSSLATDDDSISSVK
jgi:hypothetical protein